MVSLVFVYDDMPGISRRNARGKWLYKDSEGNAVTDKEEIARLNAIALPPAYEKAWFAPIANAHLLATGWDARGRKQYRYHPEYRSAREADKFDNCSTFGSQLPRLRSRVDTDLRSHAISKDRAIASIVRLLDMGSLRIGNEVYARANKSFGATTLRMRHVSVTGPKLSIRFRAKSGKECVKRLTDKSLARFVRAMQDLPGQRLFQFLDEQGAPHPVTSSDVNAYIRDTMGYDFTAKHFRTWSASITAFTLIYNSTERLSIKTVLETVAERLGNTPAIARKSYVHPHVLSAIGSPDLLRSTPLPRSTRWLSRHDRGLIAFLDSQPACQNLLCA